MAKLVPKTGEQLIAALEDHLFLLHQSLTGLRNGEHAYVRELAGKLRALVCISSNMEGLLWRIVESLDLDANVTLKKLTSSDLTEALPWFHHRISAFFNIRASSDDSDLNVDDKSVYLKEHFRLDEAVMISRQSMTYEDIIKQVSEKAGIAHEADGISKELAALNSMRSQNLQPYIYVLDYTAREVLKVGESVLSQLSARGYARRRAPITDIPSKILNLSGIDRGIDLPVTNTISNIQGGYFLQFKNWPGNPPLVPAAVYHVQVSRINFYLWINRRKKLVLQIQGLLMPNFAVTIGELVAGESLFIGVSWDRLKVLVNANGKLICGD